MLCAAPIAFALMRLWSYPEIYAEHCRGQTIAGAESQHSSRYTQAIMCLSLCFYQYNPVSNAQHCEHLDFVDCYCTLNDSLATF